MTDERWVVRNRINVLRSYCFDLTRASYDMDTDRILEVLEVIEMIALKIRDALSTSNPASEEAPSPRAPPSYQEAMALPYQQARARPIRPTDEKSPHTSDDAGEG